MTERRKGTTPLRGRPLDEDGAIEFERSAANQDSPAAPAAADGLHTTIPIPIETRTKEDLLGLYRACQEDSEYWRTTLAALRQELEGHMEKCTHFCPPECAKELQAILGKHFGAAPEQGGEKHGHD